MFNLQFNGTVGSAELKKVKDKDLLTFSVAVNTGWGENKKTEWVKCDLWGVRAPKLAQWVQKGTKLIVTGDPKVSAYESKDGQTKASLGCFVKDLDIVTWPEKKEAGAWDSEEVDFKF